MADGLLGPGGALDPATPVAGLGLLGDIEQPGPFRKGFGAGVAGVKSSLAGAGALAARVVGAKELEAAALEKAAAEAEVAAQANQPIEKVDFSSPSAVIDQFKWLLGNALPSLATMFAGGVLGRGLGALAGRGAAAAKRTGTLVGAVAPDVALEAGGIFPEALQTGVENPALRAIAGGTAAASLDFLPLLAAERYLKAAGRGGFGALLKGAVKGAPVGAVLEGAQETGQSAIERLSAGRPLTGDEALSDYINSFAGGAAPGLVFGAGIGAHRGAAAPRAPAPVQVPPVFTPSEQPPIVNAPVPEPVLPTLGEDIAPQLDLLNPLTEQARAGTYQAPGVVADQLNRNVSPEAQDADLTRRDMLATQHAQLTARVAELEPAAVPVKGRKTSETVTAQRAAAAELETVKAQLGAITPELGALNEAIKTRRKTLDVLAETPEGLNPAIIPKVGSEIPDSGIIQTKPETEPEAIDRAVKGVHALFREQGMLLGTTREALATPTKTPREVALEKVAGRAPRVSQKDTSISDKIGEREARAIRTAQAAVEIVVAEKVKGSVRDYTPAKQTALTRKYTDAVNSVVQEAAALPTLEARQQRAREDIPKALPGLDKETREAVADEVARTLYSKGAVEGTNSWIISQIIKARPIPNAQPSEVTLRGAQLAGDENAGRAGVGTSQEVVGSIPTRAAISKIVAVQRRLIDTLVRTRERGTHKARGAGPAMRSAEQNFIAAGLHQYEAAYLVHRAVQASIHGENSPEANAVLMLLPDGSFINPSRAPQNSSAALTSDRFHALPRPAQEAAVDLYNRAMTELGHKLIARLRMIVGDDPHLTVSTYTAEPGGPVGGYTRTGPLKAIISMALNAKNGLSIADHEGFHYAEDRVLTSPERQIIATAFKPGRPLFEKLMESVRRYDLENKTRLADEVASIPAEARAYGFEFWRRGELQAEGALARIFEKIRLWLEKVANLVKGLGFQSIEDVFKALDMGKFAEREKNQASGLLNQYSYSSKAAVDMRREMQEGALQWQQEYQNFTVMHDRAAEHGPDNVLTAAYGAVGSEIKGGLARWWQKNMATTNFVSHFSNGVKNVYRTLNTYIRYRKLLIENMLRGKMPTWYHASFADQDITFAALLKRTVNGYARSSPELAELRRGLETPERQRMFDDATNMIEGFLSAELESDRQEWKSFYIPGYESLPADRKAEMDALIEQHRKITPEQSKLLPDVDRVLYDQTATYREEITDREAQVAELIDKGYVPLRRYGDHIVVVTAIGKGQEGSDLVVNRMGFESETRAAFAIKTYQDEIKNMGLEGTYRVEPMGFQHKSARETTMSARQFIDTARRNGVPLTQPEVERIVKALTRADSMMRNRMMRREGTPGYSVDGMRVLNEFGVGMSGKLAYAQFASAIDAAAAGRTVESDVVKGVAIIKADEPQRNAEGVMEDVAAFESRNLWRIDGPKSGHYRNLADEVTDYVLVPDHTGEWSKKLRGAAMVYFLGGSISGAMVNTMSVPMLTVPELSLHTEYYNAVSTALSSWKQAWQHQGTLRDLEKLKDRAAFPMKEIDAVPGLREAITEAADVIFDTEVHQIMGMAQGTVYSKSRTVQRAVEAWMQPFRISEQMNRATSFIAAYKVGQQNGLGGQKLFTFARELVTATQNNYDPSNRPGLARNPITAIMFMFKSFPLFMIEAATLMYKANPKTAVYMLLGLTMMTGVQGLPFAETLEDMIDTIAQRVFNSPFNTRRAMRNVIKQASEAIVGYDASELVLRGLINEVFGISASSRIGTGDFVPGTRLGTADADQGRVLEEMFGAPYAMLKDSLSQAGKLVSGVATLDWKQSVDALRAGGPVAVRNVIKGAEQLSDGYASDSKGRRLVDIGAPSAMFQLIGLSSAGLAAAYDRDRTDKQTLAFYTQVRADMEHQLASAIKAGDGARAQDVWDAATAWDESNPDMPLRINPAAIRRQIVLSGLRLDERTLKLLPRQLRGTSLSAEGM